MAELVRQAVDYILEGDRRALTSELALAVVGRYTAGQVDSFAITSQSSMK